jgi:hypothetical protein
MRSFTAPLLHEGNEVGSSCDCKHPEFCNSVWGQSWQYLISAISISGQSGLIFEHPPPEFWTCVGGELSILSLGIEKLLEVRCGVKSRSHCGSRN